MTILVAVKKDGRVYLGADRMMTAGSEYTVDIVNGSKLMKLKHAYLATSGYTLLDNCIEHLFRSRHKMMENPFANRSDVFQCFLDFYAELKKNYTLVDTGKETYAGIYNVFLVVTPTNIYGVSQNLSVNEYARFAAKGSGADYAQGCLYGLYDLVDDGLTLTRVALESACHFSVYCKEPLDIVEVKASDFGKLSADNHKAKGKSVVTHSSRSGLGNMKAVSRSSNSKTGAAKGKTKTTVKTKAASKSSAAGKSIKPKKAASNRSKSK